MYFAQQQKLLYTAVSHDDYVSFKIFRITTNHCIETLYWY